MRRLGDFDRLRTLLDLLDRGEPLPPADRLDLQIFTSAEEYGLIRPLGEGFRYGLTREGCDVLDLIAQPDTVEAAVDRCVKRGVDASLEVVTALIRQHVMGPEPLLDIERDRF